MAQYSDVSIMQKTYTRTDFTALRAYVLRVPIGKIADLYYSDDCPQIVFPGGLMGYLTSMRDDLIDRAIDANPFAAESLKKARTGGHLTEKALEVIFAVANAKTKPPLETDPFSMWFKPKVSTALKDAGISTLHDLIKMINARGPSWWRSIPRIGQLKGRSIVRWLVTHQGTICRSVNADIVEGRLALTHTQPLGQLLNVGVFGLPGRNRGASGLLIQASNDIEAIQAFLLRYREASPHTADLYHKEALRLLHWCALILKRPLSDVLMEEAETYKQFLADPPTKLVGTKVPRSNPRWKPFNGPLCPSSQKVSFAAAKRICNWLVYVGYLSRNPFQAVRMPGDSKLKPQYHAIALPELLWNKLIPILETLCMHPEAVQERIALAAILLAGDSGLRRSEMTSLTGNSLSEFEGILILNVLGKGNKWREVPISRRTLIALENHWADREIDRVSIADLPMLSPVQKPRAQGSDNLAYLPNSLARVIVKTLKGVASDSNNELSDSERQILCSKSTHSFRHTFGTHATANGVSSPVVQAVLGHADSRTTAIYTRSELRTISNEMGKFHSREHRYE